MSIYLSIASTLYSLAQSKIEAEAFQDRHEREMAALQAQRDELVRMNDEQHGIIDLPPDAVREVVEPHALAAPESE